MLIHDQKTETCDAGVKLAGKTLKMQAWERRKQQLKGKKRNTTVFNEMIRCTG